MSKLSDGWAAVVLWLLAAGAVDVLAMQVMVQGPPLDSPPMRPALPARLETAPRATVLTPALAEDGGPDETEAGMMLGRALLERAGLTLDPHEVREALARTAREFAAADVRRRSVDASVFGRPCRRAGRVRCD
jgi:hypothetical protein